MFWLLLLASSYGAASTELDQAFSSRVTKPMQILSRGSDGKIHLNQRAVTRLAQESSAMEVVSIVGGYHSGKSFLLNQMLGLDRSGRFAVTGDVEPTTEGIWAVQVQASVSSDSDSGDTTEVLVLDTEGLSATENDVDYDAKIFAICTVLSSVVLYSSVGGIDARELEYLELLAQRTQLFAMKSGAQGTNDIVELAPSGDAATLPMGKFPNSDQALVPVNSHAVQHTTSTLTFPPFIWVVNSFHMNLKKHSGSAKKWLHSLLKNTGAARGLGLLRIFNDPDCATLYMPVNDPDEWADLNALAPENLHKNYKADLDILQHKVLTALMGTSKDRRSGKSIAMMLELLVTAANDGTMQKMPSMWESMMKVHLLDAANEATKILEKSLVSCEDKYVPWTVGEFEVKASALLSLSETIFNDAIFGFKHPMVDEELKTFKVQASKLKEAAVAKNKENIRMFIQQESLKALSKSEAKVKKLSKSAVPSKTMSAQLEAIKAEVKADFGENFQKEYGKLQSDGLATLQIRVENVVSSKSSLNANLLDKIIERAKDAAVEHCHMLLEKEIRYEGCSLEQGGSACTTLDEFETHTDISTKSGVREFDSMLGVAENEPTVSDKRKATQFTMGEEIKATKSKLEAGVSAMAAGHAKRLSGQALVYFRTELDLPMDVAENKRVTEVYGEEMKTKFQATLKPWEGFPHVVKQARSKFAEKMGLEVEKAQSENRDAWVELFEAPLKKAKRVCMRYERPSMFLLFSTAYPSFPWPTAKFTKDCAQTAKEFIEAQQTERPPSKALVETMVRQWIRENTESYFMGGELRKIDDENAVKKNLLLTAIFGLLFALAAKFSPSIIRAKKGKQEVEKAE